MRSGLHALNGQFNVLVPAGAAQMILFQKIRVTGNDAYRSTASDHMPCDGDLNKRSSHKGDSHLACYVILVTAHQSAVCNDSPAACGL